VAVVKVKLRPMNWIYLSPHLDDAALSCGGLIWQQNGFGQTAQVWTICAGDPPSGRLSAFAESLQERWGTGRDAIRERRLEDAASCGWLNAPYRHFDIPDCIYRQAQGNGVFLYPSEEALFGPLHAAEMGLVDSLSAELLHSLPPQAQIVCPLAIGGHVDHMLTRTAAEQMGKTLYYYADFPYVLSVNDQVEILRQSGWKAIAFPIQEPGLAAWGRAVAAHDSQISTFWPSTEAMQVALRDYAQSMGGVRLWQPPG
jgi:LmbE family N-acetylglucosaminyl deacetylase